MKAQTGSRYSYTHSQAQRQREGKAAGKVWILKWMEKSETYTSYLFGNHVEGLELVRQRIRKIYFKVPFKNFLEMTSGEQIPNNQEPEGTSVLQPIWK
jgi:hypothetical protein